MKESSIQLKHYHYEKVLLEVNQGYQVTDNVDYQVPDVDKINIQVKVNEPESLPEGETPFFAVELRLFCEDKDFPYSFDVELFGVVGCTTPLADDEEKHEHMFVVNSVSLLYSSIRDQLLTLSSRYRHGPMMLPSVDFRSLTKAGE